ncbi:MAG TPA: hypothetical protein DE038_09760, partial [Nitrospina sp.]|nr:hypothetical protein [Nitrospina sp.]
MGFKSRGFLIMGRHLSLIPKKVRSQVKLRFLLVWLVIFILMSVLTGGQVLASGQNEDSKKLDIPKEPGWNHPSYRGWESLSITGLI